MTENAKQKLQHWEIRHVEINMYIFFKLFLFQHVEPNLLLDRNDFANVLVSFPHRALILIALVCNVLTRYHVKL